MTKQLLSQCLSAALLLTATMIASSCASTGTSNKSGKSEDLDISMTRKEPALVQSMKTEKDMSRKASAIEVKPEEQLSWRQFFKAPPAVDKRSEIESKIKTWKNTKSPDELVKRGQNEAALGKLSASEASYREALRLDPKNLEAALELSGNYLKKNDLTRAFEMLSQVRDGISARSQTPTDLVFRYRYVLALAYINRGDRDKGHKVLSDLIGINKTFAPGYAALASSYMNMGKDGVAEFIAKRGLDRGNDDPMLMNILGVLAERKNEGVAARSWYNKAIEAAPTFSPALVNRANLAIKELEFGPAEEDLLRALMYSPTSVDAQVALAIVFRRTGRTNLAKDSLTKTLEQDPDSAIARFNLGVLMMVDLNQSATATRLFNEVLQISGSHAELRDQAKNHLAELRIQAQSTDE